MDQALAWKASVVLLCLGCGDLGYELAYGRVASESNRAVPALGSEPVFAQVPAAAIPRRDATPRQEPVDAEPIASSAPEPEFEPESVLVATSWQTFVYERPDFSSPRLGYLRSGTVVARSSAAEGFAGCAKGFYRIEPQGYVCVGKTASLDPELEIARIDRHPDRDAPLPYRYAEAGRVPPDLLTRLPSGDAGAHFDRQSWSHRGVLDRVPRFLSGGLPSLRSNGERMSELQLVAGTAVARSSFALVDLFEHEGRGWGVASDLLLVPLDRVVPVEPSRFRGLELGAEAPLPLAFVMERGAHLYALDERGALSTERTLEYREAVLLTGEERRLGGRMFLVTRDGRLLRKDVESVRVEGRAEAPHWAKEGRPWIDVSILDQTLVAYVGTRPVYATLVSTGRDGVGDPDSSQATVQGEFLIHTKHVTHGMSSDVEGDVYDHRDVPYVQFFKDGYALHAAYWHDGFGRPRSHGCINLSPEDARWLFEWSEPRVPEGWHGALSLLEGTLVSVHP